jgi:hypothetical protein
MKFSEWLRVRTFTLVPEKVDSLCFRIIKIPERWVENEILDSISLYTKMMCTIQGLENITAGRRIQYWHPPVGISVYHVLPCVFR